MTLRLTDLTSIAFRANGLLDQGASCAIAEVHQAIERGELVDFLDRHDELRHLREITKPREPELNALMADLISEQDDKDLLVHSNGFALVVAYCLELIQRRERDDA